MQHSHGSWSSCSAHIIVTRGGFTWEFMDSPPRLIPEAKGFLLHRHQTPRGLDKESIFGIGKLVCALSRQLYMYCLCTMIFMEATPAVSVDFVFFLLQSLLSWHRIQSLSLKHPIIARRCQWTGNDVELKSNKSVTSEQLLFLWPSIIYVSPFNY